MKMKLTLIAALFCGLSSAASAFTLDFIGDEGTTLPADTLVITILGYGDVRFEARDASVLSVGNDFENDGPGQTTSPSLNFDTGESATITFLGLQPINVQFDTVGLNTGEFFVTSPGSTANEFIIALNGIAFQPGTSGAGLFQVGFDQVPEPSSALLGLIGSSLLVLRRRR